MLRVFATQVMIGGDRKTRDRLFRFLGQAEGADFIYANRGPERYLVHSKDAVIGREVFLSGQFDFDKVESAIKLVAHHTGRTDVEILLDIGANIGTVCVPAVARGLVKRAIAIEPDPTNCRLLRINALLNRVEAKVAIFESALGDTAGAP
jgi:hypothetical protein